MWEGSVAELGDLGSAPSTAWNCLPEACQLGLPPCASVSPCGNRVSRLSVSFSGSSFSPIMG